MQLFCDLLIHEKKAEILPVSFCIGVEFFQQLKKISLLFFLSAEKKKEKRSAENA